MFIGDIIFQIIVFGGIALILRLFIFKEDQEKLIKFLIQVTGAFVL